MTPILIIQKIIERINQDCIFIRTSSLTYQTFLTIVPLLAVMFGIAKGFGVDTILQDFLQRELSDHKEVLDYMLSFSQTTLNEARGGVVAGAGIAILFFTTMRLFSAVEETFNAMWGITIPRQYLHRVMSYLGLIFLSPLLIVITISSTLFLSNHIFMLAHLSFFEHVSKVVILGASLIPLGTLIILFSTLLYIIPSAKVSYKSALASGTVAAIFFQLFQSWYIYLQVTLTKVSTIYGSFAALPLFLAWLWMSWLIFLISGELSVMVEEKIWRFSKTTANIPSKICNIAILTIVIQRYQSNRPISIPELSYELNIPIKLLYYSLEELSELELIYEGSIDGSSSIVLLPAMRAFSYTIGDMLMPEKISPEATLMTPHDIQIAIQRVEEVRIKIDTLPDAQIRGNSL